MRKIVAVMLVLVVLGVGRSWQAEAVSVSSGDLGDALIFPLFDANNVNTLIAIESFSTRTHVYKVRFREEVAGAEVLSFELCLPPFATWSAAVVHLGPTAAVISDSTHLVNGSTTPLQALLSPDATRGFIEVIGLRANPSGGDTAICTDPALGGDASNATMGKAYFVNPTLNPVLAYGMNALALKDFSAAKIADGTVLGNDAVADALVLQGVWTGAESQYFGSRYFVDSAFGAETQVVMTFAPGPVSGPCPSCKVPSSLTFAPYAENGSAKPPFARPTGSHLVNIFTLTSSDIPSPSGVLSVSANPWTSKVPVTGFVVQTTSAPPPGYPYFNVLFPLVIK